MRSYQCSPTQFSRVLAAEKILLSEAEVDALIKHYSTEDGKLVNYKEFTDEVENTFINKNLTKSPTLRTVSRDLSNTKFVDLTPSEQQLYEETVEELKLQVANRRMSNMETFQDHDRLKNHHITVPQFKRCMPFTLSDEQMAVIVKKYVDGQPQNGINYYQFVTDISAPPTQVDRLAEFTSTEPLKALPPPVKPPPEAGDVVTKVRAIVVKGRIRLMEFFRDFDKLRSYVCLPEHFRSALSAAHVCSRPIIHPSTHSFPLFFPLLFYTHYYHI